MERFPDSKSRTGIDLFGSVPLTGANLTGANISRFDHDGVKRFQFQITSG